MSSKYPHKPPRKLTPRKLPPANVVSQDSNTGDQSAQIVSPINQSSDSEHTDSISKVNSPSHNSELTPTLTPTITTTSTPPSANQTDEKKTGNDRVRAGSTDADRHAELLESLAVSRVRIPGETKSACKERLRMLARNAGLPRGTGPGTAYEWAMLAVIDLFAPPPPDPVSIKETEETEETDPPICDQLDTKPSPDPVSSAPIAPVQPPPPVEPDVPGLGVIPESWPALPPNAPLQAEIAWVSANRLVVRSGKGVDLSRALSPAPSYAALSWLETSILFPSKFADISVKATADQDTEKELVKRERMAIEEIRSLLKEMLEAK